MSEFNWNEFDPNTEKTPSRDPIPAGEYVATITESVMKDNQAGTGQYLALSFQIAEGPHEGRFAWANLNLVHTNEKAVQIARSELAELCKALGILSPKDSADLHDKPVLIRLVIKKDRDGNPRNEIKGFKPAASQPPQPAAPAPKAANTPPWKKK